MRGIQYAAACRVGHCRLWNTGSSAFADDDSCECGVIADMLAMTSKAVPNTVVMPRHRVLPSASPMAGIGRAIIGCGVSVRLGREYR